MKAIVQDSYGSPDVLQYRDVDRLAVADDTIVVKVHAASVNPADWHFMTGTPYLVRVGGGGFLKPKRNTPGLDMAGTVAEVGTGVTEFEPGDEVFGEASRAYAEYASVKAEHIVTKPADVTMEQASTVGVAAFTALQGLRDKGGLVAGQKVLINGSSGGVGMFAVQIAKSFATTVTAVCSTRKVDLAAGLGADYVVDYTSDDVTRLDKQFDLILDTVGNRPLRDWKRILSPDGTYVAVGGPRGSFQVLWQLLKTAVVSRAGRHRMVSLLARTSKEDLVTLADLMEAGKLTPVIDRTYQLSEAADALRHQGKGHAQGKTVIVVG
ncbi:MAG: NAD(P)-dependent alcohol dehydrogenase [bacterium]|nr:NAD(P)-dependent alcohol dehydrogenase [bacterium]